MLVAESANPAHYIRLLAVTTGVTKSTKTEILSITNDNVNLSGHKKNSYCRL